MIIIFEIILSFLFFKPLNIEDLDVKCYIIRTHKEGT